MKTPDVAETEDIYGRLGPHVSGLRWWFATMATSESTVWETRSRLDFQRRRQGATLGSAQQLAINLRPQGLALWGN